MAAAKYPTLSPGLTAGELTIDIYPRQRDWWQGTAEQLTAEGLIPDDFQWPNNTRTVYFTHKGVECSIQRKRPAGSRVCLGVDNWQLWRQCEGRGNNGARLYEAQQALARELWRRRPEGRRIANQYWRAYEDQAFQPFKRRALGIAA